MNKNIFRAYDIRGNADTDLESGTVLQIGLALAAMCSKDEISRILIGRDTRPSSERICQALRHALSTNGIQVLDMGVTTSPGLYWASANKGVDTAVMITGSHNPWTQNGLKIIYAGRVMAPERIQELGQLCDAEYPWYSAEGSITEVDFLTDYREFLKEKFSTPVSAKVVIDFNYGPSKLIVKPILEAKGVDAVYIKEDSDSLEVNPDPSGSNLNQLVQAIRDQAAHYGIAFDGDADRVVVVDRTGQVFDGDALLCMLAKSFIQENPGEVVLTDIKASRGLIDKIESYGGKVQLWKTGHSFIKARMAETGYKLAGENSGHMYYGENHNFDDGVFAALKLMDALHQAKLTPVDYLGDMGSYVTEPIAKIPMPDDIKFQVVDRARDRLIEMGYTVLGVDGARVESPKAWGLIRASNTEACITTRFEAVDQESLNTLKEEMLQVLAWASSGND